MTPTCAVTHCVEPVRGRGYCNTHYRRWQRHGDPRAELPIEAKTTGGVGYWSIRQRLKTERGPASTHQCADCGAPARDWSYDGTDPHERTDAGQGYRYSLDLHRYRPRCRACHRRATLARTPPRPRSRSVADIDRAARLYTGGASARGIARLLGTSRVAVYRALHEAGVQMRPRGTRMPPPEPDDQPQPQENEQHYRPSRDQQQTKPTAEQDTDPTTKRTPTPRHPDPMAAATPLGDPPADPSCERTDRSC